jgi:cytochrome c556
MRRLTVGLACLSVAVAAAAAYAVEDPILTRQKLMKSNGGAAGAASAMLKGEIPFHAAVGRAALMTMNAVAYSYGDYFPEGSQAGDTKASPKIWEDPQGFAAALAEFQQDTDAALQADPQDLDAFKAAFGPVAENCKTCHETFRLADD